MSAFGIHVDQSYIPLLTPKVVDRITVALNFITIQVPTGKVRSLSRKQIVAAFGDYSIEKRKLAVLLKSTLLQTETSRWSMIAGECKEYKRNQYGFDYWTQLVKKSHNQSWFQWKQIHIPPDANTEENPCSPQHNNVVVGGGALYAIPHQFPQSYSQDFVNLQTLFSTEFKSLNFKMKFQGNRYLHPLHKHSADFKSYVFAQINIPYNYDIENAMPSLLVQFAKKHNPDIVCPLLDEMLIDKNLFRDYIIEHYSLDKKKAKDVICSLFNDSGTTYHPNKSLPIFLGSYINYQCFVADKIIIAFRRELDAVWEVIRDNANVILTPMEYPKTKSGAIAKKRGPIISAVYRKLERLTMDVIHSYIKSNKVKWFREHDGFNCNKIIDAEIAQQLVQAKTGYQIKLAFNPNPYIKQMEI